MRWIALALSVAAHAAVLTWPVAMPTPVESPDFRFAVKPSVAYVVIDPRPPPPSDEALWSEATPDVVETDCWVRVGVRDERPRRRLDLSASLSRGGGGSICRPQPPRTPDSVERALDWLERAQGEDGSWEEGDVGVTALATLALLSGGRTHRECDAVRRALAYLIRRQDGDGAVTRFNADHSLATLALCEAYATTGGNRLKRPAQAAVNFLAVARDPCVGWAILAVHSAHRVGLAVDRDAAYADARAWLDVMPTAVAAALRRLMDRRGGAPPAVSGDERDYEYLHWAALAGAEAGIVELLQEANGSWPPADRWSRWGGRVYATAMASLTLQTARRYPVHFGRND